MKCEQCGIESKHSMCKKCDKEIMDGIAADAEAAYTGDQETIEKALENKSDEFKKDFEDFLEDSQNHSFSITTKAPDEIHRNKDEEYCFKNYTHQTTNGGYTGDDYSGVCWIDLGNKEYLEFLYYC